MRDARLHPLAQFPAALATVLALVLAVAPCARAGKPAGEPVDINGRVVAGLDKTFIKDQSQGYFLVQGVDLSRFAGRLIQARGLIIGQEQEFRVVRLLEYRLTSPDDDSPGAGGLVGQGRAPDRVDAPTAPARKKK